MKDPQNIKNAKDHILYNSVIWNVQKRQISRGRRVDPLGVGMGYCCSDAKLYPTTCLCNPTDCAHQAPLSMGFFRQEYWSGLPFPSPGYHLLEFAQTFVHWVSDAIQSSHPLWSLSPPALNLSQHQGLFQWVSFSHQVAKVFELQLQHQSLQWILRVDSL